MAGLYGFEDLPRGRMYTSEANLPQFLSRLLGYVPRSWPEYAGYESLTRPEFESRHFDPFLGQYLQGGGIFPKRRRDVRDIPGGIMPSMVEPTAETYGLTAKEYPFYPGYMGFIKRMLGG